MSIFVYIICIDEKKIMTLTKSFSCVLLSTGIFCVRLRGQYTRAHCVFPAFRVCKVFCDALPLYLPHAMIHLMAENNLICVHCLQGYKLPYKSLLRAKEDGEGLKTGWYQQHLSVYHHTEASEPRSSTLPPYLSLRTSCLSGLSQSRAAQSQATWILRQISQETVLFASVSDMSRLSVSVECSISVKDTTLMSYVPEQ